MNVRLVLLALVLAAAIPGVAHAQYGYPQYPGPYAPSYSGYGYYHHASTLEEGMSNGYANIVQSWGVANLLHSQAARNYQEAYSRDLDNRVKAAATYVQVKRMKREYAASLRVAPPSPEKAARYAKDRAPSRLTDRDLDPISGRISWPAALEDEAFQVHRDKLEEIALKWARYNSLSGAEHLALQQSTKAMQTELKSRMKMYSSTDYIAAKNLLESLAYEVVRPEATVAAEESGSFVSR